MTTHKIVKSWTTEAGLPAVILLVNDGSHHCGYVALPADNNRTSVPVRRIVTFNHPCIK